jgi:hypothetical protein
MICTVLWWITFVLILTVFLKLGFGSRGIVPGEFLPYMINCNSGATKKALLLHASRRGCMEPLLRGWTVRQVDKLRHARVLHTNRHDRGRPPCIGHCSGMDSVITKISSSTGIHTKWERSIPLGWTVNLGSSVDALGFCCSVAVLVCCVTVANSSSASLCCRDDELPYVGEIIIELSTHVWYVKIESYERRRQFLWCATRYDGFARGT